MPCPPEPPLPPPPCCTGFSACLAWPREWNASDPPPTPLQRRLAASLARHWLAPFSRAGITPPRLFASSATSRLAEARLCPIVQLLSHRLYLVASPQLRLLDMRLPRCDAAPIPGDDTPDFCPHPTCRTQRRAWERHRLHAALRLLSHAARASPHALPDLELRLCADDSCHGVWESPRRARPLFTMASCADAPTLPLVQWNAEDGGRDVDLSAWDEALAAAAARGAGRLGAAAWRCRSAAAIFRGAANQRHAYNGAWSDGGGVARARTTAANFNASGRWALVGARLAAPRLLNVRLSVLRRGEAILGARSDPPLYARRVAAVSSDAPPRPSLEAQAAAHKLLLHVEGHGGWADRLKHLLPLGAAVLKQSSGVTEWFEPLLTPAVHFLPVRGDLANLTAAIEAAHAHDDATRAVAAAAVAFARDVLPSATILEYSRQLLGGYAQLMRYRPARREGAVAYECWRAVVRRGGACARHPLAGRRLTECGFVPRAAEARRRAARFAARVPTLRAAANGSAAADDDENDACVVLADD
ncbi:hypothetical protein AB1Y20_006969 [Prymnesium parvum]|uniref:Glycosyl transferase CAP10 domain-containing protein n=1 Tax=Prymnesium parvum TaxID=97485 RepID=A0AB34IZY2_PRYPA